MISGSSIDRASLCPVSEALPHCRHISDAASMGTAVHEYLADVSTLGLEEALARVDDDHYEACKGIDVSRLPACDPDSYAAEVSFAYNPSTHTAREIGRGIGRDYSKLEDGEIPGSADVVGVTVDSVLVMDYKTGWGKPGLWQLKFYALAAARAYGRSRATVAFIYVREGLDPWYDYHDFDELDLDSFEVELAQIISNVAETKVRVASGEHVPPTSGEHCKYCPAFSACPAQRDLAAQLGSAPTSIEDEVELLLNGEAAAEAWKRIKAARAVLDRVEETVRTYAEESPVDLGDGIVLGPKAVSRDSLDGSITREVLMEMWGEEVADKAVAVEVKATKKGVNNAARVMANRTGETIKSFNNAALEEIEHRGGLTKVTTRSVREFKGTIESPPDPQESQEPTTMKGAKPEKLDEPERARTASAVTEDSGAPDIIEFPE